jgi:hypothetical protein
MPSKSLTAIGGLYHGRHGAPLLALMMRRNISQHAMQQGYVVTSLTAIGGHDRQFFDMLLWGLVISTVFVRC